MAVCTVSGTFLDSEGAAVVSATVRFNLSNPSLNALGSLMVPKEVTTTTDSNGAWSLVLVQETSGILTLDLVPAPNCPIVKYKFSLVMPATLTATFPICWADSDTFGGQTPSNSISFSEISGTLATNQLPTLPSANIWVGNASNLAAAVTMSGDGTLSNTGVLSVISGSTTNAVNATNGATVAVSTNAIFYPLFAASSSNSNQPFNLDAAGFTYNPSSNTLLASTFVGSLNGNADTATTTTNITTSITGEIDASYYPVIVTGDGSTAPKVSGDYTFNPGTNTLTVAILNGSANYLTTSAGTDEDSSYGLLLAPLTGTHINQSIVSDGGITYNPFYNRLELVDALVSGNINMSTLTAHTAVIANGASALVSSVTTDTELSYVSGVTSAIQTQLTGKQSTTLNSTQMLVGSSLNSATARTISGAWTMSNTGVATLANNIVTNAKAAQMAQSTIKGRAVGAGTGDPVDLTATQATAILNTFTSSLQGLVPASSGGTTTFLRADGAFAAPTSSASASYELTNLGLAGTVAANALTIALKQASGSDCSSGSSACVIGFRNATSATGQYSEVSVTAALSTVISSGSTAGHASGVTSYLYIYAINNAGTVELAWSSSLFDEGSVITTTAEGGAGAADSSAIIYSTTARTGVALRLIGRFTVNEATAGTWASAPTEISLVPFMPKTVAMKYNGQPTGTLTSAFNLATIPTKVFDSHNAYASGTYTIKTAGLYRVSAQLAISQAVTVGAATGIQIAQAGSVTDTVENYEEGQVISAGLDFFPKATATFNCAAGDTIKINGFAGGTSTSYAASAARSWVSIERIGSF